MRKASNFDGSVYKPSRHLPAKTPDRRQQHSSGVFVNFEQTGHLDLVFLFLTLNT